MDSIKQLPCGVCSRPMGNVQQIFGLHCGHVFHEDCLLHCSRNRATQRRCIKCGIYTPLIYRLFETSEQIEKINNLEEQLKKLNMEKDSKTELEKKFNGQNKLVVLLSEEKNKLIYDNERLSKRNKDYAKEQIMLNKQMNNMTNEHNNALTLLETESNQNIENITKTLRLENQEKISKLEDTIKQLQTQLITKNMQLNKMKIDIEKSSIKGQKTTKQSVATNTENSVEEKDLVILNEKFRILSEELNNEISKNTKLQIEKLRLQAYVDCLKK